MGWGAGVSNSRFYFGSELGWVEKLEENHSLFFSFTLRPASAVGNVGAIIFGECFHNVNYLRNAPRKKGLKLGKNVESRSTTLAEKYWTNITRYPPIGLWVSTLLILVMVRFISV